VTGFGEEIRQMTGDIVELNGKIKEGFTEVKEVKGFGDEIGQITKEIVELSGKIREGFTEVKDELSSMIKFSYADLEKKINALEARIKALEKMVFP
jgi:peptidoglycan hydrolase CwlO-like protein